MEDKNYLKGFFVDDENAFQKDKIKSLIDRCKKFSMLVGKKGNVNIEKKGLSGTDKIKLFLITRYLGGELAKLEPDLGINPEIANVHSSEIAKLLSLPGENARTRISDLVSEGFGLRPEKGFIRIVPHKIENFLESLENFEVGKKQEQGTKKKKNIRNKTTEQKPSSDKVNIEEIIKRLSVNLNITENKIKDLIFIRENGNFKFNKNLPGKSKYRKQTNCILCSAFVITLGLGKGSFSSRQIKDVCFESNLDTSGINYAIRELKNKGYITKAGRRSQENMILEAGKQKAKTIFSELCK